MKKAVAMSQHLKMDFPIRMVLSICIVTVVFGFGEINCQILEHGEKTEASYFFATTSPQYQYSQNIAILNTIETDTWCNGFDYFKIGDVYYIVIPMAGGYRFFDISDPFRPIPLGTLELPEGYWPRDVETAYYGDTTRIFLVGIYEQQNSMDPKRPAVILDVLLIGGTGATLLVPDGRIANTEYGSYGISIITPETGVNAAMISNIEMLHRCDRMLFVASNTSTLQYYNVVHHNLRDSLRLTIPPDTTGTLHKEVKIHEVKTATYDDGTHVVGLGTVRSGIRIIDFTTDWNNPIITAQIYDFDRASFPDTVINPYKYRWDTLSYSINNPRCNKWDHRVTHSVVPYESEAAKYVLSVDEFTSSVSGQNENGEWNQLLWEGIDFYEPNLIGASNKVLRYYNSAPIDSVYECVPDESSILRLNYIHRNHPSYPDVDPLRLQGAFLRIWDRSLLGVNDTSANNASLILNAYDVQESSARPEGYIGRDNIPKVADVPTGLHEPTLWGDLLYLAGYNAGARILHIAGPELSIRGYVRTEPYLSNDPSSSNYYNRPDLIMYAKGIYRLVPDTLRSGLVYGSDLYQGIWILRYIDSTLTDTLTHIQFQPRIRIGSIDATHPRRVSIGSGGAVIADSAIVEFVDNTSFSWDSDDSLVVLGQLELGTVYLDSAQHPAPRNKIYVGDSGVVYIGGMEKTITGKLNLHVGRGGRAVILAGTNLQLADSSIFLVEGDLTFESCTLSDGCHFIARSEGSITMDHRAEVVGLLDCVIADKESSLTGRRAQPHQQQFQLWIILLRLRRCLVGQPHRQQQYGIPCHRVFESVFQRVGIIFSSCHV
ncbi:MAG: hypothetical protein IH600_03185 [Bacteroidetes bacterium]|nr:hypothetical protein [Bacteroidota bacterium]